MVVICSGPWAYNLPRFGLVLVILLGFGFVFVILISVVLAHLPWYLWLGVFEVIASLYCNLAFKLCILEIFMSLFKSIMLSIITLSILISVNFKTMWSFKYLISGTPFNECHQSEMLCWTPEELRVIVVYMNVCQLCLDLHLFTHDVLGLNATST
jgi:hypothetical protein